MEPEVQGPEMSSKLFIFSIIVLIQGGYINGLINRWYFKALSITWSLLLIGASIVNLYLIKDFIHEIISQSTWPKKIHRIADVNLAIISALTHINFLILAFFYKMFLMKAKEFEESKGSSFQKTTLILCYFAPFVTILSMVICMAGVQYTGGFVNVLRILLYFKIAFQKCGFTNLFLLMSSCLCALFHNFTESFKQDMVLCSMPCRDLGQCFEKYRRRYEKLVDFVSWCDKFVCVPLGLTLLSNIVYLCLMVYLVFVVQQVYPFFLSNVFFLVCENLYICLASGILRTKVRLDLASNFRKYV